MEQNNFLNFKNKTILITGAASGIGKEAAILFSSLDASVILVDIDFKKLKITQKMCGSLAEIYQLDVSDYAAVIKFWESLKKAPDVLINNAGVYPFIKFEDLSPDQLSKIVDINMNSVFWMCQEYVKRRKKNGNIINLSTIEAILPFKENMAHYTATKAGVLALTRALAKDYAKKGFRSNVILPGAIMTPTTRQLAIKAITSFDFSLFKVSQDFKTRLPMGYWGQPKDVAKVMVFLGSDLSSYVNGAVIAVDGGFLSA
jgi:NAD(P)-dependent dehydrogenase (short-subunit alcohol dehydrogenase family)